MSGRVNIPNSATRVLLQVSMIIDLKSIHIGILRRQPRVFPTRRHRTVRSKHCSQARERRPWHPKQPQLETRGCTLGRTLICSLLFRVCRRPLGPKSNQVRADFIGELVRTGERRTVDGDGTHDYGNTALDVQPEGGPWVVV